MYSRKETLHLRLNIWLDFELLNLLFLLKLHPVTLERQFSYLKCFVAMPLWQSNNLIIILCHQSFLLHCLALTCRKLLPFLESILLFSYDFKNIEHLITLVNSNAASKEPLIIFCYFNGITVNLTEERDHGNISNGLNLVYARCYSNLSTNHAGMLHQALI